jgi:hypothetical protein
MADSGLASLTKSQAGFGGLSSGGGSGSGIAAGAGGLAGGGGSMAVHSRGDEAFMDRSASATLDAHRVGARSHQLGLLATAATVYRRLQSPTVPEDCTVVALSTRLGRQVMYTRVCRRELPRRPQRLTAASAAWAPRLSAR